MDTVERIVSLAKKRGLSQEALERAAGLSANRISKWKNPDEKAPVPDPKLSELSRMAAVLRVTVGYLIGETDDAGAASLDADEQTALRFYRKLLSRTSSPADALSLLADLYAALGVVPPGHRVTGVSLSLERLPDDPAGGAGPGGEPLAHVRKRAMPDRK